MPNSGLEFSHVAGALDAVARLERHLVALHGCADVLTVTSQEHAGAELRRTLTRAITALRVLQDEVECVLIVVRFVIRAQAPS